MGYTYPSTPLNDRCDLAKMQGAECLRFVVSVFVAIFVVGVLTVTSGVGSFLNRSRGGFIHFGGPTNQSDPAFDEWYWPNHILSRVFFAFPTGLLVVSEKFA